MREDAIEYILGVDPGARTGFAVVRVNRRTKDAAVVYTQTTSSMAACAEALAIATEYSLAWAVVQTPADYTSKGRRNKVVFFRRKQHKSAQASPVSVMRNAHLAGRVAGSLTSVMGEANVMVIESQELKRSRLMKMKARIWSAAFGYRGRTSEHVRDAVGLVAEAMKRRGVVGVTWSESAE